ncbi:MAG: lytic transglycosylase domain-containing protein [Bacillota bacterium]
MIKSRNLLLLALLLAVAPVFMNIKQIGKHFYPLKYHETVTRHARENGLDPLLVTAIIKVESNFNPGAVSPRGAVGLMQLMPETARWVAAKRGEPFNTALLFDPEANIRFGTWYLTHLRQEFGDTLLALAAYNGGRTNVKKWLEEQTWTGRAIDLDQVPFPETRQFVRKTIWTYRIYRYLYPEASARTAPAQRAQSSA